MLVKDRGRPALGALILPSQQRETLYCTSITCRGIIVGRGILCPGFASSPATTLVSIFSAFYCSISGLKPPTAHCSTGHLNVGGTLKESLCVSNQIVISVFLRNMTQWELCPHLLACHRCGIFPSASCKHTVTVFNSTSSARCWKMSEGNNEQLNVAVRPGAWSLRH